MHVIVPAIQRSACGYGDAMADDPEFEELLESMKKAAGALREGDVPFALTGGLAVWARGGPRTEHDVDFLVKPADAERAQQVLAQAGMRTERPPEGWLLKAWDDDRMIDLIFDPSGGPVEDAWLERADVMEVYATTMPVAALEDVLVTKLMSLNEQDLDYSSVLELARSVREQLDWAAVRERTNGSPYAAAFFRMVEDLGVAPRRG
jgi:Uncharacterised nucleotidyltransferase